MPTSGKYSIEGIIASVLFIILVFVLLLQITGRTGIFIAPVWTEELARWVWVWMALIAIGEVERTNGQLRMGFLISFTSKRFRKALFTVVDVVYLGITGHLAWIGYTTVVRTWNSESVTLIFTDAVLYASYFVASLFIIWRVVSRIRATASTPAADLEDLA